MVTGFVFIRGTEAKQKKMARKGGYLLRAKSGILEHNRRQIPHGVLGGAGPMRERGHQWLGLGFAVAMALTSPATATDFLFSEDNQITNDIGQLHPNLEPKALLRQDKWLNEPLTRLDYVLMKIETTLPERLNSLARSRV